MNQIIEDVFKQLKYRKGNIMKQLKQIIRIILIVLILFASSIGKAGNKVEATFFVDKANLYSKGSYGNMLKYNGVEVLTTYVVYSKDGVEYPAYCLDANMPGVGENGSYTASVTSLLNDVMIWRVITNGYPYKTISQLGCNTKEEAFAATKQAVYCIIYGREASWYEPIGEQGVRVRNAMAQILNNARAATDGKPSSQIIINELKPIWDIDPIWSNWISKTYTISTSTAYNTYTVSINGNYPEDTKIVNEQNQVKTTFNAGEKFKIIMPLKNLKHADEFNLNVTTKLNTKPILYGKAPNSEWQDYALTANSYEDATGSLKVSYFKNDTKIIIKKQDAVNLIPLEGVEFRIVDKNQNPVYTNLITDNNGRIELGNMLPGEYFLEEVRTKDGYVKYEWQIPFNLKLNQTLTVTVNNNLESKYEYVNNTQDITINSSKHEIIVKDDQEYTKRDEIKNIITELHNQSFQNTSNIINEKNGNYNLDIINSNINENSQNINNNTNISNENTNINQNNQNQNTNINNENTNINHNNQNININNENTNENTQNINSNISQLNGIVKLPKTGM